VEHSDLDALSLDARLVGADQLYALGAGADTSPVRAGDVTVLLDADEASWSSWNRYAEQFARETGAHVVHVDDGGVTGSTFFDHVRRLRRPVLNNPKGQNDATPGDLARRPVVDPTPMWTWSLVWRRGEDSAAVGAVIEAFTADLDRSMLDDPGVWLPAGDPHRPLAGREHGSRGAATSQ
jgi:hypothetical protein